MTISKCQWCCSRWDGNRTKEISSAHQKYISFYWKYKKNPQKAEILRNKQKKFIQFASDFSTICEEKPFKSILKVSKILGMFNFE